MKPDYHFTAFWATEEPTAARALYHGHQAALQRHGLGAIVSGSAGWLDNPGVLAISARTADGSLAGGIRLHCSRPGHPMQLVAGLAAAHPGLLPVLAPALLLGAAESCGMWVAAGHSRRGLPELLLAYSIALGNRLVPCLFGLAAPHTLEVIQQQGFEPVRQFGEQGNVAYPTPAYISTLVEWRNGSADSPEKAARLARIHSLQAEPAQLRCEQTGDQQVWVRYTPAMARPAMQPALYAARTVRQAA